MKTLTALLPASFLVGVLIIVAHPGISAAQAPLEGPGSGLVAWWKFDEGSGTSANDSSGNGNNATFVGVPQWTTGPVGGALSLNGTTDYLRIPLSSSLGLGVKTIAVWANVSDFIKRIGALYGWGRGSGCADNYQGYVRPDGGFTGTYQNTAEEITVRPTSSITALGTWKLGEWAHYAIVYNASGSNLTIAAYKNGVLAGTPYVGTDGLSANCAMTAIGSQEDFPNPNYVRTFSGILDDYRIYNRALSAEEISELYAHGRTFSTDITPPSPPTGLTGTAVSASQINLSWSASTDNVGVAGYNVYRGGMPIATVRSGTAYSDTAHAPASIYSLTVSPSTTYTYSVSAYDSAGNFSAQSPAAIATTPAALPSGPYSLSVTISGSGGVPPPLVVSSIGGISCSSGTCTASFSGGTAVVLTPYPFIYGMRFSAFSFTGWTGSGCSGRGECFILMDSDKILTASYGTPSPPDITPPAVTAFSIPATASSLVVPVTAFTASDNIGVSGYIITESASAPTAGDAYWLANPPGAYTFSSAGGKTLYGWAKDAANNVSASRSASVTISLIDIAAPVNLHFIE